MPKSYRKKIAILCFWGLASGKEHKTLSFNSDKLLKDGAYGYVRRIHHHPCQGIAKAMHDEHRFRKNVLGSGKLLLGISCL